MTKNPTLQNLIDEVMEEFDKEFGEVDSFGEIYYPSLSAHPEKVLKFLRQSLLKIAQATAGAGRIEKEEDEYECSGSNTHLAYCGGCQSYNQEYKDGFNQAVQEQQQKLKEFLGEYYDQKKAKEN